MAFKPIGAGPIGSFGRPPANLDMRVVDEAGAECPPGVLGELVSRPITGAASQVTYFNNQAASEQKTAGGWLRSGDICHRDAEGWLYFDYRNGGGIRRNGDFINPGFVEAALAEIPSVTDVYVYGVPSASGAPGEKEVVAAIVVDRTRFDAAAVFTACQATLEANFVPSFLQVLDEIPKTASEKPQDRFLIEALQRPTAEVYRCRNGRAEPVAPEAFTPANDGRAASGKQRVKAPA
jgi:crotonobetaine/carnitine-CoA ligase